MKTTLLALALVAALFMGAHGSVINTRSLLAADIKSNVASALQGSDAAKLQQTVSSGTSDQQSQVVSAITDQITAGSDQAQKVPNLLAQLGNVTAPENPQLASKLPSSAQQLEQNTGITKGDLQKVASQVAGNEGTKTVESNPSAAQPGVTKVLETVGGGTGMNETNQTMGGGKRKLLDIGAPILELYRKALAAAICSNPTSAAGAVGAGVTSSNDQVALATLQALSDSSNTCCTKAAQAADAGYKVAQGLGKGDLFIFRLFFAVFQTNLQFCAVPPSFFTGR